MGVDDILGGGVLVMDMTSGASSSAHGAHYTNNVSTGTANPDANGSSNTTASTLIIRGKKKRFYFYQPTGVASDKRVRPTSHIANVPDTSASVSAALKAAQKSFEETMVQASVPPPPRSRPRPRKSRSKPGNGGRHAPVPALPTTPVQLAPNYGSPLLRTLPMASGTLPFTSTLHFPLMHQPNGGALQEDSIGAMSVRAGAVTSLPPLFAEPHNSPRSESATDSDFGDEAAVDLFNGLDLGLDIDLGDWSAPEFTPGDVPGMTEMKASVQLLPTECQQMFYELEDLVQLQHFIMLQLACSPLPFFANSSNSNINGSVPSPTVPTTATNSGDGTPSSPCTVVGSPVATPAVPCQRIGVGVSSARMPQHSHTARAAKTNNFAPAGRGAMFVWELPAKHDA